MLRYFNLNSTARFLVKEQAGVARLKSMVGTSAVMSTLSAAGEEMISEEGFKGERFFSNLNSGMAHSSLFSGSLSGLGRIYAGVRTKFFATNVEKVVSEFSQIRAGVDLIDGLGDLINSGFEVDRVGLQDSSQSTEETTRKFAGWLCKVFAAGLDTFDDKAAVKDLTPINKRLAQSRVLKKASLQELRKEYMKAALVDEEQASTVYSFYDAKTDSITLPNLQSLIDDTNFSAYSPRLRHCVLTILAFHESYHQKNHRHLERPGVSEEIDAWLETAKFARTIGVFIDFSSANLIFKEIETSAEVFARNRRLEQQEINRRNGRVDDYLPTYQTQLPKRAEVRGWVLDTYQQDSIVMPAKLKRSDSERKKTDHLATFESSPDSFTFEQTVSLYHQITRDKGEFLRRVVTVLEVKKPEIVARMREAVSIDARITQLNEHPDTFLTYELIALNSQISVYEKNYPNAQSPRKFLNDKAKQYLAASKTKKFAEDLLPMEVVLMVYGIVGSDLSHFGRKMKALGLKTSKGKTGLSPYTEIHLVTTAELQRFTATLPKDSPPRRILAVSPEIATYEFFLQTSTRPYIKTSIADRIRGYAPGRTSHPTDKASRYTYGLGKKAELILLEDLVKFFQESGKNTEARILSEMSLEFALDPDRAVKLFHQRMKEAAIKPDLQLQHDFLIPFTKLFPFFGFNHGNPSPSLRRIVRAVFKRMDVTIKEVPVGKLGDIQRAISHVNLEGLISFYTNAKCAQTAELLTRLKEKLSRGELAISKLPQALIECARQNPCLEISDVAAIFDCSKSHVTNLAGLQVNPLPSLIWGENPKAKISRKFYFLDVLHYLQSRLPDSNLAAELKSRLQEIVDVEGVLRREKLKEILQQIRSRDVAEDLGSQTPDKSKPNVPQQDSLNQMQRDIFYQIISNKALQSRINTIAVGYTEIFHWLELVDVQSAILLYVFDQIISGRQSHNISTNEIKKHLNSLFFSGTRERRMADLGGKEEPKRSGATPLDRGNQSRVPELESRLSSRVDYLALVKAIKNMGRRCRYVEYQCIRKLSYSGSEAGIKLFQYVKNNPKANIDDMLCFLITEAKLDNSEIAELFCDPEEVPAKKTRVANAIEFYRHLTLQDGIWKQKFTTIFGEVNAEQALKEMLLSSEEGLENVENRFRELIGDIKGEFTRYAILGKALHLTLYNDRLLIGDNLDSRRITNLLLRVSRLKVSYDMEGDTVSSLLLNSKFVNLVPNPTRFKGKVPKISFTTKPQEFLYQLYCLLETSTEKRRFLKYDLEDIYKDQKQNIGSLAQLNLGECRTLDGALSLFVSYVLFGENRAYRLDFNVFDAKEFLERVFAERR
ncbi:MAG: hypothetical protein KBC84_08795 [Proteobacteria bacterium]|nr:hypothetical protein [Pseudomonadota bacterium]